MRKTLTYMVKIHIYNILILLSYNTKMSRTLLGYGDEDFFNLFISNIIKIDDENSLEDFTFSVNNNSELELKKGATLIATFTTSGITFAGNLNVGNITATSLVVNGDFTVDTDTLYVDSSNNKVGIGTNNPSDLLHLKATLPSFRLDTGVRACSIGLNADGEIDYHAFNNDGNVAHGFRNNGGFKMLNINNSGLIDILIGNLDMNTNDVLNIGTLTATTLNGTLGTASQPNITSLGILTDLDINGRVLVGSNQRGSLSIDSFSTFGTIITINNDSGNFIEDGDSTVIDMNTSFIGFSRATGGTGGNPITYTSTMFLNSSNGNVGIGTTTPSTTLDVIGDITATNINITTLNMSGNIDMNSNEINESSFIELPGDTRKGIAKVYNSGTGDAFGIEQVSGAQSGLSRPEMRLFTSGVGSSSIGFGSYTDTTTFNHQMVITNSGDIGIGTNSPQITLAIGNQNVGLDFISSTEFRHRTDVDTSIWKKGEQTIYNAATGGSGGSATDSVLNVKKFITGTTNNVFIDFFANVQSGGSPDIDLTGTFEGDIRLDGGGNLAFQNASDIRLKENIVDYTNGYNKIKALRTVEYEWKDEKKKADIGRVVGFIAQEVQLVLPKAVGTFIQDDTEYYGVSQSNMIPFLWSALRTLINKVEILEEKVSILEQ